MLENFSEYQVENQHAITGGTGGTTYSYLTDQGFLPA